jgi:hypothetical protein
MNDIQKKELEAGWIKLGDIPVIEDEDSALITDEDFSFKFGTTTVFFIKGTGQLEIWHWFDDLGFSVGNRMNGLDPWKIIDRNSKKEFLDVFEEDYNNYNYDY